MDTQDIKSMNLYRQAERIYNDLRALGIDDDSPLDVETLNRFDQYHYLGTDAVDEAIGLTGINADSRVLDVGSGLGGPARYLAKHTGCHVTALELQDDFNEVAATLTGRCGLSGNIDHVCSDVLTWQAPHESHDQLVSYLAMFHIADPTTLFSQCATTLKPGGRIYIEDLYGLGEFTDDELHLVRHMVYGQNMATRTQYITDLQNAGFTDIGFTDMTAPWTGFCRERLNAYRAGRSRQEEVHGKELFEALDEFYATMLMLFESGHLGGVRVTATKA